MDQLVKYDTAHLAKEKGFKGRCSHYYKLDFSTWSKSDGIAIKHSCPTEYNSEYFLNFCIVTKSQPHLASAPTQTTLAKWLRDVHNIHVFQTMDKSTLYVPTVWYNFEIFESKDSFPLFEQALEEGIKMGLNLIKKNGYSNSLSV